MSERKCSECLHANVRLSDPPCDSCKYILSHPFWESSVEDRLREKIAALEAENASLVAEQETQRELIGRTAESIYNEYHDMRETVRKLQAENTKLIYERKVIERNTLIGVDRGYQQVVDKLQADNARLRELIGRLAPHIDNVYVDKDAHGKPLVYLDVDAYNEARALLEAK